MPRLGQSGEGAGACLARRNLVFFLVVLASLGSAGQVFASDTEEAESLIRQGSELRREGRDEVALPYYQKAYGLVRSPRTAGQLGLAERATGYWLDAEQHLLEALESADHPWIAKNRKVLEEELAVVRSKIGEIILEGAPPGASVTVNGRAAATLPSAAPIRVPKGRVDVIVSAPAYVSKRQIVQIAGGDRQRLTAALAKVPETPPPTKETASDSGPLPPTKAEHKVAWAAGITGAAALTFGLVESVVFFKKRSDFEGHKGPPPNDLWPTRRPGRRTAEQRRRARAVPPAPSSTPPPSKRGRWLSSGTPPAERCSPARPLSS